MLSSDLRGSPTGRPEMSFSEGSSGDCGNRLPSNDGLKIGSLLYEDSKGLIFEAKESADAEIEPVKGNGNTHFNENIKLNDFGARHAPLHSFSHLSISGDESVVSVATESTAGISEFDVEDSANIIKPASTPSVKKVPSYMRATVCSTGKRVSNRHENTVNERDSSSQNNAGCDDSFCSFSTTTTSKTTQTRLRKHTTRSPSIAYRRSRFSTAGSYYKPLSEVVDSVGLAHEDHKCIQKKTTASIPLGSGGARFAGPNSYFGALNSNDTKESILNTPAKLKVDERPPSQSMRTLWSTPPPLISELNTCSPNGLQNTALSTDGKNPNYKTDSSQEEKGSLRLGKMNSGDGNKKGFNSNRLSQDDDMNEKAPLITSSFFGKLKPFCDIVKENRGREPQNARLEKPRSERSNSLSKNHDSLMTPKSLRKNRNDFHHLDRNNIHSVGRDTKGVFTMKHQHNSRFSMPNSYLKTGKGSGADGVGLPHNADYASSKNIPSTGPTIPKAERFGKYPSKHLLLEFERSTQ